MKARYGKRRAVLTFRLGLLCRVAVGAACVLLVAAPPSFGGSSGLVGPAAGSMTGSAGLAGGLLAAVRAIGFNQLADFGPEGTCPGAVYCVFPSPLISQTSNIDVAVIELDRTGRPTDAADVLLSRDYPEAVLVPVNSDLGTTAIRFLRWNIGRWDGGTFSSRTGRRLTSEGWSSNPPLSGRDDIVPGRDRAPVRFMEPYPASLFKLMVAFQTLRLSMLGCCGSMAATPTSRPLRAVWVPARRRRPCASG